MNFMGDYLMNLNLRNKFKKYFQKSKADKKTVFMFLHGILKQRQCDPSFPVISSSNKGF
jgi:hypothetical protein